ncbi:MAG: hypothetical protein E6Q26_05245, partial [Acinetobacter sp.]
MMAKMPIDPRLSRMLVGGAHFGVLQETLIIDRAFTWVLHRQCTDDD